MISKIYIDNYKCFTNFELSFSHINVIFGKNGVGKSSIFELLEKIRLLISGLAKTDIFLPMETTRWDRRNLQTFGIDAISLNHQYNYRIDIFHDYKGSPKIQSEELKCDGKVIVKFSKGEAQVFNDNYSPGPLFPLDPSQSVLSIISSEMGYNKVFKFKKILTNLLIVKLDPEVIFPLSDKEVVFPKKDMSNFVDWYRHLSQEHQQNIIQLQLKLRDVLPGFQGIDLPSYSPTHRGFQVSFKIAGLNTIIPFAFSELSDGQRALIILYTLLYGIKGLEYILCIDEPENFVSLEEIQPWLMEALDSSGSDLNQVLIISHHPEAIDYLAAEHGIWLDREENGPVKRKEIRLSSEEPLKLSQLIERGWD